MDTLKQERRQTNEINSNRINGGMRHAYRTIYLCRGIQGEYPAPDRFGVRNRVDSN